MTRSIIAILFVIFGLQTVNAQRLFPKQKGVETFVAFPIRALGNDFAMEDFSAGFGYTVNAKNGNYKRLALEYHLLHHTYKNEKIPSQTYILKGGYSFFLLGDASRTLAVNLTLNGLVGYEQINHNQTRLLDGAVLQNESRFVYGSAAILSVETYLTHHWLLLFQGNLNALWGTTLANYRPSVGVGIRYMF